MNTNNTNNNANTIEVLYAINATSVQIGEVAQEMEWVSDSSARVSFDTSRLFLSFDNREGLVEKFLDIAHKNPGVVSKMNVYNGVGEIYETHYARAEGF